MEANVKSYVHWNLASKVQPHATDNTKQQNPIPRTKDGFPFFLPTNHGKGPIHEKKREGMVYVDVGQNLQLITSIQQLLLISMADRPNNGCSRHISHSKHCQLGPL